MTTTVRVEANPFKAADGTDLEVVVTLYNTKPGYPDEHFAQYKLQRGEKGEYSAYEGRKVVVEEVPKR